MICKSLELSEKKDDYNKYEKKGIIRREKKNGYNKHEHSLLSKILLY